MKKFRIPPEVMLPICTLGIGIWFMCFLIGLAFNMWDMIVLPIMFSGAAGYSAFVSWKECRSNRIIAEGIINSIAEEVKKSFPDDLPNDKPIKHCPPHQWNITEGKYICTRCHNPPGGVK